MAAIIGPIGPADRRSRSCWHGLDGGRKPQRSEPRQDRGEGDHRQEVRGALLVTRRDPALLLQSVDEPFHPIALAVGGAVEAPLWARVALAGDHRPDAPPPTVGTDRATGVTFVGHHPLGADARPPAPAALDGPLLQERPARRACGQRS